ncbi:MAG: hypothetical protein K2X93_11935 [Candidatus Obscuribacterales bacterium]|nr:hypothetical protein [Candidatus Obscuribacterales bacterium]
MVSQSVAIAVIISLFWIANIPALAADYHLSSKLLAVLLTKRAQVQHQIHNSQQRLRQLEQDRRDKLEELGELTRAHAELANRRQFTKAVEDEIAVQNANLRRIEEQRSDCLEELDGLYIGLSEINRDIADSSQASN